MIDWDKPIETVNGMRARYIGKLDNKHLKHTQVVIEGPPGHEFLSYYDVEGKDEDTGYVEIRNSAERKTFFIAMVAGSWPSAFDTLEDAVSHSNGYLGVRSVLEVSHEIYTGANCRAEIVYTAGVEDE